MQKVGAPVAASVNRGHHPKGEGMAETLHGSASCTGLAGAVVQGRGLLLFPTDIHKKQLIPPTA